MARSKISPPYPAVPFEAVVRRLTRMVKAAGEESLSPEGAAEALGFRSFHGGARRTINTLQHYGLILLENRKYRATTLAREVVGAEDDAGADSARRRAMWTPEAFRALFSTLGPVCADDAGRDHLSARGYKDDAITIILAGFRRTVAEAGTPDQRSWRKPRQRASATNRVDKRLIAKPSVHTQSLVLRDGPSFAISIVLEGDIDIVDALPVIDDWLGAKMREAEARG